MDYRYDTSCYWRLHMICPHSQSKAERQVVWQMSTTNQPSSHRATPHTQGSPLPSGVYFTQACIFLVGNWLSGTHMVQKERELPLESTRPASYPKPGVHTYLPQQVWGQSLWGVASVTRSSFPKATSFTKVELILGGLQTLPWQRAWLAFKT